MTVPGEKFFEPDFGSRVSKLLFENVDDITASQIQEEIEYSISNYEPRVNLIDVEVLNSEKFNDLAFKADRHELNVKITYEIVGVEVPAQELQFVLQSSR